MECAGGDELRSVSRHVQEETVWCLAFSPARGRPVLRCRPVRLAGSEFVGLALGSVDGDVAMARLKQVREAELGDSEVPPLELCRFVALDWYDPGDEKPLIGAIRRWEDARRSWATGHGFDLSSPWGARSGQDWWAFLRLCESAEGANAPE